MRSQSCWVKCNFQNLPRLFRVDFFSKLVHARMEVAGALHNLCKLLCLYTSILNENIRTFAHVHGEVGVYVQKARHLLNGGSVEV
jgi:hypothetical protein